MRLSDRGVRVAVAGPCLVAMLVALVWIGSAWSTAAAVVELPLCAPAASAPSVSPPSGSASCLRPLEGRLVERTKWSPRDPTEWGIQPDGAAYASGSASFPMGATGDLRDARGSQVTGLFHGGQLAGVDLPGDALAWSYDAAETRILFGPYLLLMASVLFGGLVRFVAARRGRAPGSDRLADAVPGATLMASFALAAACAWGAGLVVACSIWLVLWFGLLALSHRKIRARSRSETMG